MIHFSNILFKDPLKVLKTTITMSDQGTLQSKPAIKYPSPTFNTPAQTQYKPVNTWAVTKDAVKFASIAGLLTVAAGNAVSKERLGPMGVFTKSGKLWGLMILVAGSYRFTGASLANLRKENDSWNEFFAGSVAGAFTAAPTGQLVKVVGTSLGTAVLVGGVFWCGSFLGNTESSSFAQRGEGLENGFEIKKDLEKQGFWDVSRRRPLSQTLEQLGDGVFKP